MSATSATIGWLVDRDLAVGDQRLVPRDLHLQLRCLRVDGAHARGRPQRRRRRRRCHRPTLTPRPKARRRRHARDRAPAWARPGAGALNLPLEFDERLLELLQSVLSPLHP